VLNGFLEVRTQLHVTRIALHETEVEIEHLFSRRGIRLRNIEGDLTLINETVNNNKDVLSKRGIELRHMSQRMTNSEEQLQMLRSMIFILFGVIFCLGCYLINLPSGTT